MLGCIVWTAYVTLSYEKKSYFFFADLSFIVLFFISMTRLMKTDPMTVDSAVKLQNKSKNSVDRKDLWVKKNVSHLYTLERKAGTEETRFCRHCKMYKPDRAHHDRASDSCVLELDHFTPWFNQTIGFNNFKYMYLTELYLVSHLICVILVLGPRVLELNLEGITGVFVALLILPMPAYLLFLRTKMRFLQGMTTVEYFEKARCGSRAVQKLWIPRSPFDQGIVKNVTAVLGPIPFLWLLPTRLGMRTDGDIYFDPVNPERSHCNKQHLLFKARVESADAKKRA